ncbi:unnamed protein product [Haemonchus placei]|uniref:SSD domain-containing protein n=1 Tax=Haemonchus placei TaxID=6290 RepID=A0A0N4W239_HAEPC|nr:unnamed protein product [Haemonchus placei]
MDGWSSENARSRYEYNVFQEFLNADGQGIFVIMILRAQDNQSMIRMEYMTETIEILEFVSSQFPMYDADLGRNQSYNEFCRGFCKANEPVRMFYNGLRISEGNVSDELQQRVNLSYPTSEMFSTKFSLLPNFFGVELEEDGRSIRNVSLIALLFRAERHPSWTVDAVKQWELNIQDYFSRYVILSITACVVPFMACGTALGAIFLMGVTFSPILRITPFLVLVETGPAIAISAFTNTLAFAIGSISSPFEIRVFCIGNAACIFMDMFYQLTFYAAMMAIFADSPKDPSEKEKCSRLKEFTQRLLRWYTGVVANFRFSLMVALVWVLFVAGAIMGSLYVTVDLSSRKTFLPDSKLLEIDRIRNKYMVPSYTPVTVVVSNPGNLSDAENVQGLIEMRNSFESLPHAIGPDSTKFLVSDYVKYKEALQAELEEDPSAGSLDAFLHWPEYSYYNGFIKRKNSSESDDEVEQFMFVTGYQGDELVLWSEKRRMLKLWRHEVDRFAERFNASVYSEDGFFIDLLEAIPVITWQSALATFVCVIIVCALFINDLATIIFVSMSIFATCIGVFGYMSFFGVTLDPIVMSISIMCIGFSVDIPAHVSFHFHASRCFFRLQHTLCSVGFPVIQAGVSTDLCALPLAFVPLYMAQVCVYSLFTTF